MSASWRRRAGELLAELARQAPLLPGADVLALVDIDSMQRRVYGNKKQGTVFGHIKMQSKTVRRTCGRRCAGTGSSHTAARFGMTPLPGANRGERP